MAYSTGTIPAWDKRTQAQMDELLLREGIRRDKNLDYSCGVFDDDGTLIAAGSSFGNTLRCLAVSGEHRGEGLMNQVVSHLMERQIQLGHSHVFLYTKISNQRIFADLGFYEIARAGDALVFMENRRDGFRRYLKALEKARREGSSAAIVMNANPFTLGHRHLVEKAAGENDTVHLFLLSEEAGPIPFRVRRALVSEGCADLSNVVIHDSGPYIISSATFPSYFLPDEDSAIAAVLGIKRRYVGQERTSRVTGIYNRIMAESLPENGIECVEIPRLESGGRVISASTVRQAIHDDALDTVADMLPGSTLAYFRSTESQPVREAIRAMADPRHY